MATWSLPSAFLLVLGLSSLGVSAAEKLPSELPLKPPAPTWTLPDMAGRPHHLADYQGQWVLMHFWATWCGPCLEELPSLDRLQAAAENMQVLAVNVGEQPATISNTTDLLDIDLVVLRDEDSQVSGSWQVQGLPTTYLVDPQGRVFGGVTGTRNWDDPTLTNWILEKTDGTSDSSE